MMKKIKLSLLLIAFSLLFVSCGINTNKVPNNVTKAIPKTTEQNNQMPSPSSSILTYDITKVSYNDKDVEISYPQISNLNDIDKVKQINEIIKSEALKVLNTYDGDVDNVTLGVDYSIKWKGGNLLSIQYIGSGYVVDGAYPNNIFYTTNIDINKATKVKLVDVFNIDESFIQKFNEGRYTVFDVELNVENESKNEVNKYSNTELINYFNKADDIKIENELSVFSYFTKDSLGISVNVPHAIGDHAEFEIRYQDLKDNIKTENEIWKDLLQ